MFHLTFYLLPMIYNTLVLLNTEYWNAICMLFPLSWSCFLHHFNIILMSFNENSYAANNSCLCTTNLFSLKQQTKCQLRFINLALTYETFVFFDLADQNLVYMLYALLLSGVLLRSLNYIITLTSTYITAAA